MVLPLPLQLENLLDSYLGGVVRTVRGITYHLLKIADDQVRPGLVAAHMQGKACCALFTGHSVLPAAAAAAGKAQLQAAVW